MSDSERAIPSAQREESDVGEGFIWGAFALLLGSLGFVVVLALLLFPHSLLDQTMRPPLPHYPQPRLQASPQADMQAFYAREMQRLNSTGWVDRAHGVAHIPIADAMQEIAREGIPGWPAAPEKHP